MNKWKRGRWQKLNKKLPDYVGQREADRPRLGPATGTSSR